MNDSAGNGSLTAPGRFGCTWAHRALRVPPAPKPSGHEVKKPPSHSAAKPHIT